ncbi:type VII secretion protein EccE [Mycobacterium sp. IDR2000157661]|uniref:type VII secretion protein EccE n=1 Tax=Mycobacterium sp. IDR2000157661 TaxID=2867005 RepID=UPI001EEB3413|nr:type VII secretion protein EccE [Mycobacterium sp. IDR2000157661]
MTIRTALALLVAVPAAMAYPWQSRTDWWLLGVAAAVVVIAFAGWRGQFLTNMAARRVAVFRRNRSTPGQQNPHRVTVVVRVEDPASVGLSLRSLAGYVERFGIRSEKVRVTTRTRSGVRTTWVSLTVDATANLAALQARSPELPLHDTAAVAGRRLADQLRESGLEASVVDTAYAPLAGLVKEMWRGVRNEHGVVSAYGIPAGEQMFPLLAEVWALPEETWTAVEFAGTPAEPTVAALCAVCAAEAVRGVPLSGLRPQHGAQRPLLTALDPKSSDPLGVPTVPLKAETLTGIGWPAGSAGDFSRT